MKKLTYSFLYFFILINILSLMFNKILCQNEVDSLSFYYKSITEIKDVSTTIKAFDFFEKKAENSLKANDTLEAAYYLELISMGQFKMGFYHKSEATTIRSLTLLNSIPDYLKVINPKKRLTNQLGVLYRKINDYKNAQRFYKQSLELSNNFIDKITIIINIANIYADQNQYKDAVEKLKPYYSEVTKLKVSNIKANYFDNLGYYQSKIGGEDALKNMKLGYEIRLKIQDLIGLFSSYRHFSYYYFNIGNFQKAKEYANKAKAISNSLNSPTYMLEAIELLLRLESNSDFKKYIHINDSLNKARQIEENKYAAIKYNIDESEKNLKDAQLQKERQQKLKLLYLFLGLLIFILSVSVVLILRSKHKKEKIKQAYLKEVEFSKKIHDELANDMSDLMNYVENDIRVSDEKKILLLDNIEDLYVRTRDISTQTASIDLINFSNSLSNVLSQHNRNGTKVVTNDIDTINWTKVQDHKKMVIYRCLQELMVNMKKHSNAKLVSIVFKVTNNKNEIRYVDDGIGFTVEKAKLNGLQNVESRIESIGGSFNFTTSKGKGFKATLKFNS